jgi:regulator of protease activity HflC (stomatin/prohibitin superfamily)
MITGLALLIALGLAIALLTLAAQSKGALRIVASVGAAVALVLGFTLSSFVYVNEDRIGLVTKEWAIEKLPPGKIIATEGETGPQADILGPGWHAWYWPGLYSIELVPIIDIEKGNQGIITARDGQPLPAGAAYAPEWQDDQKKQMINAKYFLTQGNGYRGPQSSVLEPGSYRINTNLFDVKQVPFVDIKKATVGVVKSNVGEAAPSLPEGQESTRLTRLVDKGYRGIRRQPLMPGQEYMNTDAYEITSISTAKRVVRYTDATVRNSGVHEESEIIVRTSDGFTFPVDVRVEFEVQPFDAPLLVATVGDDLEGLRNVMNSAVRAIFRNNAETVKAINYVKERSQQESQSLKMLQEEMKRIGVTVMAVRIGDVGDENTLGELLKTQTDREIALQEQATFQEQQRAAEQKKELTRTEQEAEEEKRLATAKYGVQISEEDKKKRVIEAEAEAESVKIKAEAQANAYQLIAEQIGQGNAALVEVLKVVGESGIEITPRVMVVGGNTRGDGQVVAENPQTTALIGTMLDSMISKSPTPTPRTTNTNTEK